MQTKPRSKTVLEDTVAFEVLQAAEEIYSAMQLT